MKSSIKVDFNNEMKPVIEVVKVYSEDTRDRLLSAWVNDLGYYSNIGLIEFVDANKTDHGYIAQKIHIRPMGTKKNLEFMRDLIQKQLDAYPEPTDTDILTN